VTREAGTVFDSRAATYDREFSDTQIGARMRAAVWQRCDARFQPGMRILEVNCGTGEDALHMARRGVSVLATDASGAMLRVAAEKIEAAGYRRSVDLRELAWEDLAWEDLAQVEPGLFDGALSNFGGLNCVPDLAGAMRALAGCLRQGAVAVLCIMGPVVPWEWAWFLLQGKPGKAFRRLKTGGAKWQNLTIRYPRIAEVRRALGKEYRVLRVSALGALLPPPFTESMARRHQRLLGALNSIERRLETVWPLPQLADHYVIELERL
jgi:ubiquinone/menaquinone biosynthesis C-methylase UbiE